MEIYVVVDVDGEPIAAYKDRDKAQSEAESIDCGVICIELFGMSDRL